MTQFLYICICQKLGLDSSFGHQTGIEGNGYGKGVTGSPTFLVNVRILALRFNWQELLLWDVNAGPECIVWNFSKH